MQAAITAPAAFGEQSPAPTGKSACLLRKLQKITYLLFTGGRQQRCQNSTQVNVFAVNYADYFAMIGTKIHFNRKILVKIETYRQIRKWILRRAYHFE
jgi:hypothetical protein